MVAVLRVGDRVKKYLGDKNFKSQCFGVDMKELCEWQHQLLSLRKEETNFRFFGLTLDHPEMACSALPDLFPL